MLIRILASGECRHIDNSTGAALISAGLAELIPPKPQPEHLSQRQRGIPTANGTVPPVPRPAPQPVFSIVTEKYLDALSGPDKKVLAVRMALDKYVSHYFGKPEHINACMTWEGGARYFNGFGRAVPAEIVEAYTRQWKANKDLRLPDAVLNPDRSCKENQDLQADKEFFNNQVAGGIVPFRPVA